LLEKIVFGELTVLWFGVVLTLVHSQLTSVDGRGKLPGRSLEPADGVGGCEQHNPPKPVVRGCTGIAGAAWVRRAGIL
jgi:hypothetical protein